MSYLVLTDKERAELADLFFRLRSLAEKHPFAREEAMTDYRDVYLDALESCSWADTSPLFHFLEYSYLETLRRISGFFKLIEASE